MMSFALKRKNWVPLFLIISVVIFKISGNVAFDLLCYDRSAIQEGQFWRLLSGHFIHQSWAHLGMNITGLILIWLLIEQWLTLKELWLTIIFSALGIGLGLMEFNPGVLQYTGLSGILHGIWTVGAWSGLIARRREAFFLAAFLILKLAWEQLLGPLPTSANMAGGIIIVDAHLYGAISGLLLAILFRHWH